MYISELSLKRANYGSHTLGACQNHTHFGPHNTPSGKIVQYWWQSNYLYLSLFSPKRTYIHTHSHTHLYTHALTHTHTYTQEPEQPPLLVHTYSPASEDNPAAVAGSLLNYFGELTLLYRRPRVATVMARTDGMLWSLHRKDFKARSQTSLLPPSPPPCLILDTHTHTHTQTHTHTLSQIANTHACNHAQ